MDGDGQHWYFEFQWELLVEEIDDPRFELLLLLARTRDRTTVTLDLSDLLDGGWLVGHDPHRAAKIRLAKRLPPAVLSSLSPRAKADARILKNTLRLVEPDFQDLVYLPRFEGTSAPGGADRNGQSHRGMAAAQVMNRVVAVLDDDTAGLEGAATLASSSLPSR